MPRLRHSTHGRNSVLATTDLPFYAELTGSDTCTGSGVTARGRAPVLALCRQLLAAGLNPDAAMEVFRNGELALRVRSIGEGAKLDADESKTPRFRRYRSPAEKGLRAGGHSVTGELSELAATLVAQP